MSEKSEGESSYIAKRVRLKDATTNIPSPAKSSATQEFENIRNHLLTEYRDGKSYPRVSGGGVNQNVKKLEKSCSMRPMSLKLLTGFEVV
ncbi:hypothetical protein EDC56_1520 [Sinobacterium caligoides]|uniref:Uncharacterized protein n=1 Tax=Sinobacterium caligoides TaxID=933926 RepID=A0A3N2DP45_9GAMM|nr:hypothetical protein EDC56_1520 [Sinobacterium caligoides]